MADQDEAKMTRWQELDTALVKAMAGLFGLQGEVESAKRGHAADTVKAVDERHTSEDGMTTEIGRAMFDNAADAAAHIDTSYKDRIDTAVEGVAAAARGMIDFLAEFDADHKEVLIRKFIDERLSRLDEQVRDKIAPTPEYQLKILSLCQAIGYRLDISGESEGDLDDAMDPSNRVH